MAQKIKLKKTLYIGLGGTGVSILLQLKKCFIDTYGEIPPMIEFLAVDTDTAAKNKNVTSKNSELIKLTNNELLVCTVPNALSVYKTNASKYDFVPQKNVKALSSILASGAGQVRSNGHFIATYNYDKITTRVTESINRINQLLDRKSPYEVELNTDGVERPIIINIFGSVAGGTGSGMLVDTLCIVEKAMKTMGRQNHIYPWILLPEVFKAMAAGPSMNNVLYNSYGALRDLDYLRHIDPANDTNIALGDVKMDDSPFRYAYLINNYNQAGISFDSIDDLAEIVAKSAFLPTNNMGDALDSPFDNIRVQQAANTFDIKDKMAWAASAGSAELVYDNQAVARTTANHVISLLCNQLMNSSSNGANEATMFVDYQNVLIREDNGRDDVIDALLGTNPSYAFIIDENTTVVDLENYIDGNTKSDDIERTIRGNFDTKLDNTIREFDQRINSLIDQTLASGSLTVAKEFMKSLKGMIAIFVGQMQSEQDDFNKLNSQPAQLEAQLNNCRNSGLSGILKGKMNEESCEVLSAELTRIIVNRRVLVVR